VVKTLPADRANQASGKLLGHLQLPVGEVRLRGNSYFFSYRLGSSDGEPPVYE